MPRLTRNDAQQLATSHPSHQQHRPCCSQKAFCILSLGCYCKLMLLFSSSTGCIYILSREWESGGRCMLIDTWSALCVLSRLFKVRGQWILIWNDWVVKWNWAILIYFTAETTFIREKVKLKFNATSSTGSVLLGMRSDGIMPCRRISASWFCPRSTSKVSSDTGGASFARTPMTVTAF